MQLIVFPFGSFTSPAKRPCNCFMARTPDSSQSSES
jgi:hypothetical protein